MSEILRDELIIDPLARGYSTMGDLAAAQDLNTKYRFRNRDTMSASEVFNAINKAEFDALPTADEALIWNVLHLGELNPFGLEAAVFTAVFPSGGLTLTALAADRKQPISRAKELGIAFVKPGHVQVARM